MKLLLDHAEDIRTHWAPLLLPGEQVLAAEFCRPRGKLMRAASWSLVEGITAGADTIGKAVGALVSRGGETLQEELGSKRRGETRGDAAALPQDGFVLAVTDRRYLVFRYLVSGLRHRLEPLAARGSDWVTAASVESRVASNWVHLSLRDGTSTTLEMTKGLGNAGKLVAAVTTLISAGPATSATREPGQP